MVNDTTDPTIAVHVDSESLLMTLGDGTSKIQFMSKSAAADLILREKLNKVTRSELRSLATRHPAPLAGKSITAPPKGEDEPDVRTWKRVALLQERFRSGSEVEGWIWWGRVLSTNSGKICEEILEMLIDIADEYSGLRNVDWIGVLRQVMTDTSSTNVAAIRTAIGERLSESDD